jgi:hypothetical protein
LKAAFIGNFEEGQTQTYRFDDVLPQLFRLFVQWLYSRTFKVDAIQDLDEHDDDDEVRYYQAHEYRQIELVQLWVLAERLIIPRLQNQVMGELLKSLNYVYATSWFCCAYAGTPKGSPLRQLAVDTCLYDVKSYEFGSLTHHFPRELLLELAGSVCLKPGKKDNKYLHTRIERNYRVEEEDSII